jgi:hypothetical protein
MNDVHGRYLRKQASSEHPFAFKDLQGMLMRTYESNSYFDRTNGRAYTAAKTASTTHAPNEPPTPSIQPTCGVIWCGSGGGDAAAASWGHV